MPGIFSWKNRLLGRKTPEPERAVHVTVSKEVDSEHHSQIPKRTVRFEEAKEFVSQPYVTPDWHNEYGEARVIGSVTAGNGVGKSSVEQRAVDWRYADDVRVSIAPLATSEIDDDLRRNRFASSTHRGSSVLQNLREQKDHISYSERRRQTSTLPAVTPSEFRTTSPICFSQQPLRSPNHFNSKSEQEFGKSQDYLGTRQHLDDMNVVFLQANDEVKRTILPPEVLNLSQVKMAFVRAFPNITRHYIEQPHVKIYIQEASKGQLFYELDDPRDIRNKSVLKIKEHHQAGMQSPVRFLEHPDYLSETEMDEGRNRFFSIARPASAMAHSEFGPPKPIRQKRFDTTHDLYASDASSHDSRSVTRSGSATPIIDKESRARMETMERQLAGLSSLVHSALVSKGMSDTTRKDMDDLRREIFALLPDTDREISEEPPSIPESLSSHTQHQLSTLRQKVLQTNTEIRQLRRTAQVNAQSARNLIKDAGDQIAQIIADKIGGEKRNKVTNTTEDCSKSKQEYGNKLANLLEDLTSFENNVETIRSSVLTSNKKLRVSEVELLTDHLTQIGTTAASLKTEFPPIQSAIESRIKLEMEHILREEKYIRDQTAAVDQSLRRCKALANIMVTMKKLAMVQDPTIRSKKETSSSSLTQQSISMSTQPLTATLIHSSTHNPLIVPLPEQVFTHPSSSESNEITAPYNPNVCNSGTEISSINNSPAALLDGVLEEVGRPGVPPRPPSRFSVQDVRLKFSKPPELPEQFKNLIENVVRSDSSVIDRDLVTDRRHELEERQERLAEKQRQLRTQFQQMQQVAPLP